VGGSRSHGISVPFLVGWSCEIDCLSRNFVRSDIELQREPHWFTVRWLSLVGVHRNSCVFGSRSSTTVGQTNVCRLLVVAGRVLRPFDSHVTSHFDCSGVCGSDRGDFSGCRRAVAVHLAYCSVAAWGLTLQWPLTESFDRWGSNRWPLIRNFPTHSTAVVQCCDALSQSNLCFFVQKSDWTSPILVFNWGHCTLVVQNPGGRLAKCSLWPLTSAAMSEVQLLTLASPAPLRHGSWNHTALRTILRPGPHSAI